MIFLKAFPLLQVSYYMLFFHHLCRIINHVGFATQKIFVHPQKITIKITKNHKKIKKSQKISKKSFKIEHGRDRKNQKILKKIRIFKILGKKSKNLRTPKDRVTNPSINHTFENVLGQLAQIQNVGFARILCDINDGTITSIQPNVFTTPTGYVISHLIYLQLQNN